METSSAKFMRG